MSDERAREGLARVSHSDLLSINPGDDRVLLPGGEVDEVQVQAPSVSLFPCFL